MSKRVDLNELNTLVASGKKLLVIFSAEWCGQCKMTKLLIEKVQGNFPDIEIVEVDVDDNDLWDHETLKITKVPTFVGFKEKQTVFNEPGYKVENALIELFNKLL